LYWNFLTHYVLQILHVNLHGPNIRENLNFESQENLDNSVYDFSVFLNSIMAPFFEVKHDSVKNGKPKIYNVFYKFFLGDFQVFYIFFALQLSSNDLHLIFHD
jgi:hypothetical protein